MDRPYYILPVLALVAVVALPQFAHAETKTIFLKAAGSTWQVPDDWQAQGSIIEVYGGGATGGSSAVTTVGMNSDGSDTALGVANASLAAGAILADSNGNDPGSGGNGTNGHDYGNPNNGDAENTSWGCSGNCSSGNSSGSGGGPGTDSVTVGGGGGAYSKAVNVSLTPGDTVAYKIGRYNKKDPGTLTALPTDTWLCETASCTNITSAGVVVGAKGGNGSVGGKAERGVGSVRFRGGNSLPGVGAGAAGPAGIGGDAKSTKISDRAVRILPGTGAGGEAGDGGKGLSYDVATHKYLASPGNVYGGGGGGGAITWHWVQAGGDEANYWMSSVTPGGTGAPGIIVITYTPSTDDAGAPPECQVTVNPESIQAGTPQTARVSWHSNAYANYDFFITNIGTETSDSGMQVGPFVVPGTRTYKGTLSKKATAPAGLPAVVDCDAAATLDVTAGPQPPTVITDPASKDTGTLWYLNGRGDPNGSPTTGRFRYSSNPADAGKICQELLQFTPEDSIGSADGNVPFSQRISVVIDKTYYFCAIARNDNGVDFGNVRTFTPRADAPPGCPPSGLTQCNGNVLETTDGACGMTQRNCAPMVCMPGPPAACGVLPITGSFTVVPNRVHKSDRVTVSWNFSNAVSCTITGTNGDTWSTLSGTQLSSPILYSTTYTATCDDADANFVQDNYSESKRVDVLPSYIEL